MKKILLIAFLGICCLGIDLMAQPEVKDVSVKPRFARGNSLYFVGGGAFVNDLADYSTGLSLEGGYMKRTNKVLSLGGSISYLALQYDASKTYKYYYNPPPQNFALELSLSGGDLSLLSAGFNIKLNVIPVGEDTKISLYGIATPFVSYYSRSEVKGRANKFSNNGSNVYNVPFGTPDTWTSSSFPALAAESKITGGVYLGVGIELFPSKAISLHAQATYGYTFPVTYVNTSAYLHDKDKYFDANKRVYYGDNLTTRISYYNTKFPIEEGGFSALTIKGGISYNF